MARTPRTRTPPWRCVNRGPSTGWRCLRAAITTEVADGLPSLARGGTFMSLRALIALASFVAFGASANAQQNAEWRQPFPAFKLIGDVYWVGTYDLSTYLITTDAGHILVNTGFEDTVPLIVAGVEQLGFKMADVKILLATHAHGDHVAGLAELKRLTGAQMMMSEADSVLLEDGGVSDFRFGDGRTPSFPAVKVDRRLKDRDTIALGGVTLTAHHHPGHTKGATSFTLTVRE